MIVALLVSLGLLQTVWFAAWPAGLGPALPLLGVVVSGLGLWWRSGWARPRPTPEGMTVVGLAFLYRLPALVFPWGYVNKDGFYGAMVALHVLQGTRPAPAFLEEINYQGTLKAHLAALLSSTGAADLSFLMAASSTLFSLGFVVVTMWLARQVGGRVAGAMAGLYVAIGPKFLTTFSLNCQGQYVEILALGGAALVLVAFVLRSEASSRTTAPAWAGIGLLLGAAFWQQPVALCYLVTAGLALALRRQSWQERRSLLVFAGLLVGVLPVLLWNVLNAWGTRDIVAANTTDVLSLLEGLPRHLRRTFRISFPILAGLSPGHPWGEAPGLGVATAALPVVALFAYLAIRGRELIESLRRLSPSPAWLPPLLMLSALAIFWAVPGDLIHHRPRYILPVAAATAVHLGVVLAWLWGRQRGAAGALLAALLAMNAAGMIPRHVAAHGIQEWYEGVVRSLETKGVRTGFADFAVAGAVTMFTQEQILISPRLGPTPNYESRVHAARVDAEGPDAYVLLPGEDPEPFAAKLRGLDVTFRLDPEPVPVFYGFSRPVAFGEVADFRAGTPITRPGAGPAED